MYYEINVSMNGKHLFATADRSITTRAKLKTVYELFLEKFPESEGYKLSVTEWDMIGKPLIDKDGNFIYN